MIIQLRHDVAETHKGIRFPDGQQNVVLTPQVLTRLNTDPFVPKQVKIKTRLANWGDLEKLVACVASVREANETVQIGVEIPYFLGARSDKKFENGGNYYLRDVICPVINNLNLNAVVLRDPHSDVLPNLLKNVIVRDNLDFIEWAGDCIGQDNGVSHILVPDAGGMKRIHNYKLGKPLILAEKERDLATGKIICTKIYGEVEGLNAVIIDDICDGGRTFVELAKEFKGRGGNNLYLVVTHGIFSAGFGELGKWFKHIYVTNSYMDCGNNELVSTFNVF